VPLEKKRQYRLRKQEMLANWTPPGPELEKFVVHNEGMPLTLPTPEDEVFAIVNIKGHQHKVMQDGIIITERQKGVDVNEQLIFDSVYLVGTKDYTLVGRPTVEGGKVWATVEQICLGKKTLVLIKKRRKGYKKHHGHRTELMTMRIDKIEYELTGEKHFENAVSLMPNHQMSTEKVQDSG
jgi:large subunit ribosomal protein L21